MELQHPLAKPARTGVEIEGFAFQQRIQLALGAASKRPGGACRSTAKRSLRHCAASLWTTWLAAAILR